MKRLMPIFDWLPGYDRSWLSGDLLAGATVWVVLIPSALAYAGIVGVDPVVGLYTVPFALVAYDDLLSAFEGRARRHVGHLSSGSGSM